MAWLAGWANRKAIAVQDAFVDGDLTNFPLYVPIVADGDMAGALATGFDLRFTLSDGTTLLYYERESWAGGGGGAVTADIWVKVPSIEASGGASIYLYWGKADAADGASPANVWDANHVGVWHSQDASDTTIADSTVNANTGTKLGSGEPAEAAGRIGRAQLYDGVDDYIDCGDVLDGTLAGTDNKFSISMWFKPESAMTANVLLGKWNPTNDQREVLLMLTTDSKIKLQWYRDGTGNEYRYVRGITQFTDTTKWYHIIYTYDGTIDTNDGLDRVGVYVDGASESGSLGSSGTLGGIYDSSSPLRLGVTTDPIGLFNGSIDEVRISDIARSADWIKFEFRNVDEADNELTWGALEVRNRRRRLLICGAA